MNVSQSIAGLAKTAIEGWGSLTIADSQQCRGFYIDVLETMTSTNVISRPKNKIYEIVSLKPSESGLKSVPACSVRADEFIRIKATEYFWC